MSGGKNRNPIQQDDSLRVHLLQCVRKKVIQSRINIYVSTISRISKSLCNIQIIYVCSNIFKYFNLQNNFWAANSKLTLLLVLYIFYYTYVSVRMDSHTFLNFFSFSSSKLLLFLPISCRKRTKRCKKGRERKISKFSFFFI